MKHRVALSTSGIGAAYGGIGVVSQSIMSALAPDSEVSIWRHNASLPRFLRGGLLAARTAVGALNRPDLVIYEHVHLAALHAAIPRLKHVPYIVMLNGSEVWGKIMGRRREALSRASMLIAVSATTEMTARYMNPWLPKARIVWLGVPRQSDGTDVGRLPPACLIVARMAPGERKGHDLVMDAWPEICGAVPSAKLFIVGTGDDQGRLERRVKRERLKRIEFCGRLSDAERDRMYRSCRLFLCPSKQEGFGLAPVEAASFGVPFLGVAGTVAQELFPEGTGAVLARDMDKRSIAQATIPVLANSDLASALGLAARARVNSCFLEGHFRKRFRFALEPLLRSGSPCAEKAE